MKFQKDLLNHLENLMEKVLVCSLEKEMDCLMLVLKLDIHRQEHKVLL